jgi:hypothetical protein
VTRKGTKKIQHTTHPVSADMTLAQAAHSNVVPRPADGGPPAPRGALIDPFGAVASLSAESAFLNKASAPPPPPHPHPPPPARRRPRRAARECRRGRAGPAG